MILFEFIPLIQLLLWIKNHLCIILYTCELLFLSGHALSIDLCRLSLLPLRINWDSFQTVWLFSSLFSHLVQCYIIADVELGWPSYHGETTRSPDDDDLLGIQGLWYCQFFPVSYQNVSRNMLTMKAEVEYTLASCKWIHIVNNWVNYEYNVLEIKFLNVWN